MGPSLMPFGAPAQVKDPVRGMMIEQSSAAGTSTYMGQAYYFCSTERRLGCRRAFTADESDSARASGQSAIGLAGTAVSDSPRRY